MSCSIYCLRNALTRLLSYVVILLYKQKRKQQQHNDADKENIAVALCNHDDCHKFKRNDISSYFTQAYYDSNPHAPRHCDGCGTENLLGIHIPVNAKHPIYQCINCTNKDEPCNHALCNGCYNKIIPQVVGNANKRIRKQTKNFEELYA